MRRADRVCLVFTTRNVARHERGCVEQVEVDTLVVRRQKAMVGGRSEGRLRGEEGVVGLAPLRLGCLGSGRAEHLAIRIIAEVSKQRRVKALRDLCGGGLLGHGAVDGVVGGHLQLVSTSNGGLLLSKDGLLLGGQVGEPLGLGSDGGGGGGLLGVHCILVQFGAVAVIVVLWKVFTIFVRCVAHFISTALFVFTHVWVVLEIEEGDQFSRARWLFHAREASAGAPLVEFLTEGVVLCLYEAEFTGSDGSLTTLGVNEGDGRVDDCALRGAADRGQVRKHHGEILILQGVRDRVALQCDDAMGGNNGK